MSIKHAYILLLGFLVSGCANMTSGNEASDFNSRILAAVRTMPTGGGYDGSDATKNLLHGACDPTDGIIRVNASRAKPSFCSGATYLVLLKALGSDSVALMPQIDQKDGHGAFGRWNSNGPGAAKLVADLGAGKNFTSWDEAQPGDFLKIWWTAEVFGMLAACQIAGIECDKTVTCTVRRFLVCFVRGTRQGNNRREKTQQLEAAG